MTSLSFHSMAPKPMLVRKGRATRYDSYPEVLRLAKDSKGVDPNAKITTASVVGLIARGMAAFRSENGKPLFDGATRLLLIQLAEEVYGADRWSSNDLFIRISTTRLALMAGVSQRQVRRMLADLEKHRWIIRHYDRRNQRQIMTGIDLRPLGARLDELVEAEAAIRRQASQTREESRCPDGDAEEVGERTQMSTMVDKNVRDSSIQSSSSNKFVSEAVPDALQTKRLDPQKQQRIMELMVSNSLTLQKCLGTGNLDDPTPAQVVRAVMWIIKTHRLFQGLRTSIWCDGVDAHGMAALAAAIIAIERPGIHSPLRYLVGMLQQPDLQETVLHSLKRLAWEPKSRTDN